MEARIFEIVLIEKVREHECLYNMKSKHYRDLNMRGEAWEDIAQEMGTTGDALKTSWNKLRNCFTNAQKRRRTRNGQSTTKLMKWKYDKEMEFLLPYLESRQSHSNIPEQPVEELNYVEDDEDHESLESNEESDCNIQSSSATYSDSNLKKRNQTSNSAQEMFKIKKGNTELRTYQNISKSIQDQSSLNNLDEVDMFYLSMARTVKRLPAIEQASIRMKLCNMISDAEIRQVKTETQSEIYSAQMSFNSPSSSTSIQLIPAPTSTLILQNNIEEYPLISVKEKLEPDQHVSM